MKNQMRYFHNLFDDILSDYGRVCIVVRHSEKTVIGKRGFTDDEKKKGMILVFNQSNCKNLSWGEDGSIHATLGFGLTNKAEKCFIHADDIVSVFSPDAKIKCDRWDIWEKKDGENISSGGRGSGEPQSADGKVVSLERFRKSRD